MTSPRILLIENETLFAKCVQISLAPHYEGVQVDTAASPHEALERIRTNDFDAILCDSDMQDMSGIEFLRETCTLRPTPAIVLMTNDPTLPPQAFDSGAFACLRKPIAWDVLVAVLKRAVEFHNLERRAERFKQVLAFQARPTNACEAATQSRTVELEKRMAEIRKNELDELIQATLSASPTVS